MREYKKGIMSANYRHGGHTPEFRPEFNSYRAMKFRCYQPSYWAYHRYGGRGIKVCDRWLGKNGFKNFLEDMGRKPTKKHSIDRIDFNGDYSPENCKWSDDKTQKNNTSRNVFETIDGVTMTRSQWCRKFNLDPASVSNRMRTSGWTFEKSVKTPMNKIGVNFNHRPRKPSALCNNCGKECASSKSTYCSRSCYVMKRFHSPPALV